MKKKHCLNYAIIYLFTITLSWILFVILNPHDLNHDGPSTDNYNHLIPFRDYMIVANNAISFYLFNDSASKDVIVGNNSWLFYAEELDDYTGTNLYTEEELRDIANSVNNTQSYLSSIDCDFVIFIAPNKTSIYGNELPNWFSNASQTRVNQLVEYLQENTDVPVVYPQKDLLEFSNVTAQTYYKLDTHWNSLGAYIGSEELLSSIGISIPGATDLTYTYRNRPLTSWNKYDLANMLGLTPLLNTDTDYAIPSNPDVHVSSTADISTDYYAYSSYVRTTSDAKDNRKVFFYRNSFGTNMVPVLSQYFREIVSPHHDYPISKSMIEREQPDLFILQMVEREDISSKLVDSWENKQLDCITFSSDEVFLTKNDTADLSIMFSPADTTDSRDISWTISDNSIVSVEKYKPSRFKSDVAILTLKAKANGTAYVTVFCGEKSNQFTVYVNDTHSRKRPIYSISSTSAYEKLSIGDSYLLDVYITPSDTTDSIDNITWKTSNGSVIAVDGSCATIENGKLRLKIEAKEQGNSILTIKCNNVTTQCEFEVTDN